MMTILEFDPKQIRFLPRGVRIRTTKGFEFKLVERTKKGKESWLDVSTNIVWNDVEDRHQSYSNIVEKYWLSLPKKEDFEEAESHGFREILPNMEGHWFWTSSFVNERRKSIYIYGNFEIAIPSFIAMNTSHSVRTIQKLL